MKLSRPGRLTMLLAIRCPRSAILTVRFAAWVRRSRVVGVCGRDEVVGRGNSTLRFLALPLVSLRESDEFQLRANPGPGLPEPPDMAGADHVHVCVWRCVWLVGPHLPPCRPSRHHHSGLMMKLRGQNDGLPHHSFRAPPRNKERKLACSLDTGLTVEAHSICPSCTVLSKTNHVWSPTRKHHSKGPVLLSAHVPHDLRGPRGGEGGDDILAPLLL